MNLHQCGYGDSFLTKSKRKAEQHCSSALVYPGVIRLAAVLILVLVVLALILILVLVVLILVVLALIILILVLILVLVILILVAHRLLPFFYVSVDRN